MGRCDQNLRTEAKDHVKRSHTSPKPISLTLFTVKAPASTATTDTAALPLCGLMMVITLASPLRAGVRRPFHMYAAVPATPTTTNAAMTPPAMAPALPELPVPPAPPLLPEPRPRPASLEGVGVADMPPVPPPPTTLEVPVGDAPLPAGGIDAAAVAAGDWAAVPVPEPVGVGVPVLVPVALGVWVRDGDVVRVEVPVMDGVGVLDGVGELEVVLVEVAVALADSEDDGEAARDGVPVMDEVGVLDGVPVLDGVDVGEAVPVRVPVTLAVPVPVPVLELVLVPVLVGVTEMVLVGVRVDEGLGGAVVLAKIDMKKLQLPGMKTVGSVAAKSYCMNPATVVDGPPADVQLVAGSPNDHSHPLCSTNNAQRRYVAVLPPNWTGTVMVVREGAANILRDTTVRDRPANTTVESPEMACKRVHTFTFMSAGDVSVRPTTKFIDDMMNDPTKVGSNSKT